MNFCKHRIEMCHDCTDAADAELTRLSALEARCGDVLHDAAERAWKEMVDHKIPADVRHAITQAILAK